MRYFLGKYDDDDYDRFFDDLEPGYRDAASLVAFARETLHRTETWWHDDGHDDPLDRVAPLYWGPRTLAEGLEREVWHTAQHTRQLAYMLEQVGVEPRGALTPKTSPGCRCRSGSSTDGRRRSLRCVEELARDEPRDLLDRRGLVLVSVLGRVVLAVSRHAARGRATSPPRLRRDVAVCAVEITAFPRTTEHFGVSSVPSMVILRDGVEVHRSSGAKRRSQIERLVAGAR